MLSRLWHLVALLGVDCYVGSWQRKSTCRAPSLGLGRAAGGAAAGLRLPNAQSALMGGSRERLCCLLCVGQGMAGSLSRKIGSVYQRGTKDIIGTIFAGVHVGVPPVLSLGNAGAVPRLCRSRGEGVAGG